MRLRIALAVLVHICLIAVCPRAMSADDGLPSLSDAEFERLGELIKPQKGESPWREIDWLTNVTEARRKAAAEGKPIVIFTAADGSPLGRT